MTSRSSLGAWLRSPLFAFGVVWAALLGVLLTHLPKSNGRGPVVLTLGDIRAMHADVSIGDRKIRGSARLCDGDHVTTTADGRARVRLDDGTLVVIGGSTDVSLREGRLVLAKGKLFVQGGVESHTQVAVGSATTTVSAAAAAFEVGANGAPGKIYCAQGELVVSDEAKRERVSSGDVASLEPSGLRVTPETAFDDWTGGLAVTWAGHGMKASAIPGLWTGATGEDPGTPLVVRAAKVDVDVDGEVAVTHVRTTYFNGSERTAPAEARLALPPGAIVSRVARVDGDALTEAAVRTGSPSLGSSNARLEWAGGGWLRGTLPAVPPGATVDLLVDYVEWLPERDGRATYRFPLATDAMIGELDAQVRVGGASVTSASAGSTISGNIVALRRGDVRPAGDLVVENMPAVVHAGRARAYVARGVAGHEDPYVLVRTEVPDETDPGIALALVVDTSLSVGVSSLETERAVVDALLEGLGSHDSLVVLAADQSVRPVGPRALTPVTPELRDTVRKGLAGLHAGGASNVAMALERAADVLDAPGQGRPADVGMRGFGMVVYIGDGRASIGETAARDIRRRLGRRDGGVPRMGAVAVGYGADRWLLAQLVAGSGPVYEAYDRADAARVGAAIVADALEPTLRDVDIDLGPNVDRVYPRESRAALAGSTVTVTGRLRGNMPDHVTFRYRRGGELVRESRPLDVIAVPEGGDVARRWAQARVEELSMRDEGIEPAIALAAQARLLTPWTGWFFNEDASSWPVEQRVLDLSPTFDAAYAARVEPARHASSLLLEPPPEFAGDDSLDAAAVNAAERAIDEAVSHLQACRDARAVVRPDVTGSLRVDMTVDAAGHATDVRVSATSTYDDDLGLDRCAKGVVLAMPFFASGLRIHVAHMITLPPARTSRRTQCSVASQLPLPLRRGIWRARLAGDLTGPHVAGGYVTAAQSCELPAWNDRRAYLEMALGGSSTEGLRLASSLESSGETDAAAFVRQELVRRVSSASELEIVTRALVGREPRIDAALGKAYKGARSDEDRLAVVRRFLALAPHNALARRRLLTVLEALGRKDALFVEIDRVRSDPFADAGLLAMGASALRRAGRDEEGRRAFGELIERAPGDPWALAFVGDRLRGEGLWDEAVPAYERLEAVMPSDPAVAIRLALAHAGAGRLDVASRLLERATQMGGRSDDGRLGQLASAAEATLLAGAQQGSVGADVAALLTRRLSRTPLPDVASVIVVRAAIGDDPLVVRVASDPRGRDERPADLDAAAIGISAIRIERGGGSTRIALRRPQAVELAQPIAATVTALVLAEDRSVAKLVSRDVVINAGGGIVLQWNGATLL